MKIILTQEVDGLGAAGDVVEVKNGYGRNFLLPQGFAIRWSRGAQTEADAIKAARSARAVRDAAHATEIKAKLEQGTVDVKVKAGQGGRLFGAVTVGDVASALGEVAGESIDKRTIVLGNTIKTLGAHQVSVKLHDDVSAAVALNVIPA
ncbi:50S ribosomal protein L9 [Nocardioides humilatus]|uniref:Large ribosomal subunit protein bL9 n=1 Tax=Nocardioides humilatus TaxID=2607660 RepID=A0A5B1L6Y0_9ACTN|nr:50S ribosomal protein L9 [Nocardioides humilatus]KAA1415427.1 50S ribosomal protein L9 [Nocardioides humilatus]